LEATPKEYPRARCQASGRIAFKITSLITIIPCRLRFRIDMIGIKIGSTMRSEKMALLLNEQLISETLKMDELIDGKSHDHLLCG
jgi:hypothetical protein